MTYKYSTKDGENTAKAVIKDAPISSKHAIELCARLRYRSVDFAKRQLEAVIKLEKPMRYTRFTEGAGHKPGTGHGKYPVKAAGELLKAIKSAESNATDKGLKNLRIVHLSAQRASTPWHYGRQGRRKMKRTHIEIMVQEQKTKKVKSE